MGSKGNGDAPRLQVLPGGAGSAARGDPVRLVAAPEHEPPFGVDALAAEEDTYFVLGADLEVREVSDHPIRLMTAVWEAAAAEPGSVVARHGALLRLFAVVHDLDRDPTCREEWVARALDGIFEECERRGLRSLALPMLGCVHGRLGRDRFLALLRQSLERVEPRSLERIWLIGAERGELSW